MDDFEDYEQYISEAEEQDYWQEVADQQWQDQANLRNEYWM